MDGIQTDIIQIQPNEMAVNLRCQSSRNTGIIIPEIVTSFFMNSIQHAQQELCQHGYHTIIAVSNEDPEQEAENLKMLQQCRVEGIQSQYPYRFVGTMIELAVKGRFASWQESSLLHHSPRSGVVYEMSADERLEVGRMADMPYHQLESFSTDALSPIGFGNPIAHRGFSFARRKRTVARRTVANGSYCLASLIPYDSPCGGIVEHGVDDL